MFKYGYVVRKPNGLLVKAGHDWSSKLDSFKVGDSLGVKNGKEGIVRSVVTGESAAKNGYDVMIIVEEHPAQKPGESIYDRMLKMSEELTSPRLTSRPQIQTEFKDHKIRAVRNKIHIRPKEETFHDFQLNLLLWTLGKPWFDNEMAKPLEQRHIILRWRHERNELLQANIKPGDDPQAAVAAVPTGNVMALQVLADDIYQLEHALETPKKVIERLCKQRQFQGARYEIAVASIFARCGFEIHFIDDGTKKNPEFIAEKAAERIAVEAKSRHREGVLEERAVGGRDPIAVPAKIREHYEEALQQNPGGIPFLVFIDVNLPYTPAVPGLQKPWVQEAMKCFEYRRSEGQDTDADSGLILTNFGWHYHRDRGSPQAEFVTAHSTKPQFPVRTETWAVLERALSEYGLIVDEEEHEKNVRARYPEFG